MITNHASDNLQTSPKQEELRKSEKKKNIVTNIHSGSKFYEISSEHDLVTPPNKYSAILGLVFSLEIINRKYLP